MTPQETELVDELLGLLIIHQFTPLSLFSLSLFTPHMICVEQLLTSHLPTITGHLHTILKIPAASPPSLFSFNQRVP